MKIIKKIVNDRNKILIYEKNKKKYVDKIFNSKNLFFFKKEKLGIKYFQKKKFFDIPRVYSYKVKNNTGKITSEYIEGKKTHVRKINQVYKSGPFTSKKVYLNEYLSDLKKNYKIKKKCYSKKFTDNYFLNKKIYVSKTHGDFVYYNCLEKDKKFYIIDFEKFRERIVVFDHLNWIIHPLTFRVSKYFCPNSRYLITKILNNSIIISLLNTLVKSLTKKFFFRLKIDLNDFDLYYFLFLKEKIFIIQEDLSYVKDKKVKSTAYKHLKFLKYICLNLSKTMNKNYNKKLS